MCNTYNNLNENCKEIMNIMHQVRVRMATAEFAQVWEELQ
jgi:hypothetical protein